MSQVQIVYTTSYLHPCLNIVILIWLLSATKKECFDAINNFYGAVHASPNTKKLKIKKQDNRDFEDKRDVEVHEGNTMATALFSPLQY